jgi:ABC-2 type transport system permease protein
MKPIWQVFTYELRRNFRRRGYLFTTFGIPVIAFALYFGYQFITSRTQPQPSQPTIAVPEGVNVELFEDIRKAGYIDLSGQFSDAGEFKDLLLPYPDETAAQNALANGDVDVYYVIEPDYLATGKVTLVIPSFRINQVTDGPIRPLVLNRLARGVDPDIFNRLVAPAEVREINLQRDASGGTESDFGNDFLVIYLFAILLMFGVFTTNGYLMQTVIEEKETRLIEVLIASMRPTQLLAGKILALGLLGLLQIAVWLAAILLFSRLASGGTVTALAAIANLSPGAGDLVIFVLYFLFGYLFFAAAYGIVGAISNSMQEGPQYAVIFTLPAVIPFYFVGIFTATPDAPLPTILSIIPVTAPLSMIMRVSITQVPVWQLLLSLTLLILLDSFMIWLAGRLFRVQTLLAGQTPKLRDIPRLVRG